MSQILTLCPVIERVFIGVADGVGEREGGEGDKMGREGDELMWTENVMRSLRHNSQSIVTQKS